MLDEQWRKSSRSAESANCVEVRRVGNQIQVRNSRYPASPVASFTLAEWQAFLAGVDLGEFVT
jgi:hypothetical protein